MRIVSVDKGFTVLVPVKLEVNGAPTVTPVMVCAVVLLFLTTKLLVAVVLITVEGNTILSGKTVMVPTWNVRRLVKLHLPSALRLRT